MAASTVSQCRLVLGRTGRVCVDTAEFTHGLFITYLGESPSETLESVIYTTSTGRVEFTVHELLSNAAVSGIQSVQRGEWNKVPLIDISSLYIDILFSPSKARDIKVFCDSSRPRCSAGFVRETKMFTHSEGTDTVNFSRLGQVTDCITLSSLLELECITLVENDCVVFRHDAKVYRVDDLPGNTYKLRFKRPINLDSIDLRLTHLKRGVNQEIVLFYEKRAYVKSIGKTLKRLWTRFWELIGGL